MKDRLITMLFVLFAFGASLKAQESVENPIKKLFLDQISFFPQEKIYIQTKRYTENNLKNSFKANT